MATNRPGKKKKNNLKENITSKKIPSKQKIKRKEIKMQEQDLMSRIGDIVLIIVAILIVISSLANIIKFITSFFTS